MSEENKVQTKESEALKDADLEKVARFCFHEWLRAASQISFELKSKLALPLR